MVLSSAHISGMIGGQQVMFANQQNMAQQIGGIYGTGPQQQAQLQNPYPSYGYAGYGAQDLGVTMYGQPGGAGGLATAGIGGMLPGAAAVGAGAMGLAGGGAGWLEPFTGVSRAFRYGAGVSPTAGFGATMSHIGSAGLRGGAAAIGGGLMMGALASVPYYAAGKALSYAGGQIAQGAGNVAFAEQFTNQLGPGYGQAGARPGGGWGRGQIQQMTEVMQEIAGQDSITTMDSVKRLMQMSQQMGMMSGVTDASQF